MNRIPMADRHKLRALGRLLEASTDLQSARALLSSARGLESRALFLAQQCVEKALKACLSLHYAGEILAHLVYGRFAADILPACSPDIQEAFREAVSDVEWVERRWADTRYNAIESSGQAYFLPSLRFDKVTAQRGIGIAARVLELCTQIVEEQYGLRIPRQYEKLREFVQAIVEGS